MKKRLLSLLLVIGMLIGMLSVGLAEEYAFEDDDGTGTWTWAGDYIYDCYEAGIINGYEDGTYLPDNELTRAEAAKIIALTFGLSSTATESTFSDVSDTHWALKYIEACVEAGIINGYTDGTFLPGQNVTRAEMAKMIAAACGLSADASAGTFSDVLSSHWALQYIEACYEEGIITGYTDGTFLPGNNISRAEAATIISRTLELIERYMEAAEVWTSVGEELAELSESQTYQAADIETQAELMLDLLENLAEDGLIDADSIAYDEANALISFNFSDGLSSGIMLEDFEDGVDGTGTDNYVLSYNDAGLAATATDDPVSFDIDGYPYEEENLTALVLWDVSSDGLSLQETSVNNWNLAYLNTQIDTTPTLAEMRTGLGGYDLLVLRLHGYGGTGYPILSSETVNSNWENICDIFAGRVELKHMASDSEWHYTLCPEFFTYYYGEDGLADTIVWIGCCEGYRDDGLVSAIADCGAKAVIGCTETVNNEYGTLILDAFVYSLLYGNTVEESLSFAKSVWGENDQVFKQVYRGETDTNPSEFRIYNGGDATLVTLTQEALDSLTEDDSGGDEDDSGTDSVSDEWKEYCIEEIESAEARSSGTNLYSLIYIDDDDVPELYVRSNDDWSSISMFCLKIGTDFIPSWTFEWNFENGKAYYIEKTGKLLTCYEPEISETANASGYIFFILSNEGFSEAAQGFTWFGEYYITIEESDKIEVSAEEYYEYLESNFDEIDSASGGFINAVDCDDVESYSAEEMIAIINAM